MTLMLRNALRPWGDLDRLFGPPAQAAGWSPRFDISETEDAYVLHLDIPGVSPKDIEVRFDEGMLSVRGERKHGEADSRLHRRERFFGSFERWFRLPGDVNEEGINASYTDGVLTLTIPKQAPVDNSRLIPVS
ncbi:MAG: Hsp20/alpha crystallin family protein [Bryobacterales bacterium]|nr:Hsp20/alpha crystallin family protein [Bryobacterales bacterium]